MEGKIYRKLRFSEPTSGAYCNFFHQAHPTIGHARRSVEVAGSHQPGRGAMVYSNSPTRSHVTLGLFLIIASADHSFQSRVIEVVIAYPATKTISHTVAYEFPFYMSTPGAPINVSH